MSNKLIKTKGQKAGISTNNKRRLFIVGLVVLVIFFVFAWARVIVTSLKFEEQMENMVLEKDYFIEEITITKKETDTYSSTKYSNSTNYYFYYGHDDKKRMQVTGSIYDEYEVGSKIPAYTTDHIYYDDTKEGILPKEEFRNNELMKCVGVLLGIGICAMFLWKYFDS